MSDRVGGRAVLSKEVAVLIKRQRGSILPAALVIAADAIKIRGIRPGTARALSCLPQPEGQVERSHSGGWGGKTRPGGLLPCCSSTAKDSSNNTQKD